MPDQDDVRRIAFTLPAAVPGHRQGALNSDGASHPADGRAPRSLPPNERLACCGGGRGGDKAGHP
jgi:hypothetical protein